jgi:dethiobiotin synthetase
VRGVFVTGTDTGAGKSVVAAAICAALAARGRAGRRAEAGRDYLVRDLAVDLGLPMVIAARTGLGTISHTCSRTRTPAQPVSPWRAL